METGVEFEKLNNKWYIVYPEHDGEQEELEMVFGADVLCDLVSNGSDRFKALVFTPDDEEQISSVDEVRFTLCKFNYFDDGGYYVLHDSKTGRNLIVWFCDVIDLILGYKPDVMYIRQI